MNLHLKTCFVLYGGNCLVSLAYGKLVNSNALGGGCTVLDRFGVLCFDSIHFFGGVRVNY